MSLKFRIIAEDSGARAGEVKTPHGIIKTPCFMPVATKGSVKSLTREHLKELGAQVLMSNTYHLYLKPGHELIREMGGLHKFMNWNGPIMTDSGGFQAFSLGFGIEHGVGKIGSIFPGKNKPVETKGAMAKIDDIGVTFLSVYDRSTHRFTPEKSIRIQEALGSDMMLAFDECTSPFSDYKYTKESLQRTHRWAEECLEAKTTKQALYGIIQGGVFEDLRRQSCQFISNLPFDGIAIGGTLGKTKKEMIQILSWCNEGLPKERPIHLLGIAAVEDIFLSVQLGIDTFDCVGPTRLARMGYAFIRPESGGNKRNKFRMKVSNGDCKKDKRPLDPNCICQMCKSYSRGYIHHLFKTQELLAYTIVTYHNLYFMLRLMEEIREAITEKRFIELRNSWLIETFLTFKNKMNRWKNHLSED